MAKGVSLPGGLYTAGAVTVNPAPYVNYYLQTRAHQQAQDEAMYKYFGDLQKNLTSKGMASEDIPGLMDRKNRWQQYMFENKDKISRPSLDRGEAYSKAMRMYNDMLDYNNRSINKVKNVAAIRPVLNNPQKNALLTDATMDAIHRGTLPLDYPEYSDFDPSTIDFNAPKWGLTDQAKLTNEINKIKLTELGTPTRRNVGNRTEEVTHHYGFSPKDLMSLQAQAASQYYSNPTFKGYIDALDDENGDAYHKFNDLFKSQTGRDIEDKSDFATAYLLSLHPGEKTKVETRTIPMNPYEQSAISLERSKRLYNYKKEQEGNKASEQGASVDQYMINLENEAKKGGSKPYTHNTGEKENAYDINLAPDQIKKIFGTKSSGGKYIIPDKVQILENGNYLPIYYQRYEKSENGHNAGDPKEGPGGYAVDKNYSIPVSRESVRASLGNVLLTKKTAEKSLAKPQTKKQSFGAGGLN